MNVNEFIKSREKDWQRLETLIGPTAKTGRLTRTASEVHELGLLYRAVISDLAIARRDFPNQRVTQFLNQLLTRSHSVIYQRDVNDAKQFWRYFTHKLPGVFRQTAVYTLVAFLLFMIPAVIGFHVANVNTGVADMLGLAQERATLADQQTWTNIPLEARPYDSSLIISNNIKIAILAFGGGISFGIFTVYILVMNGLNIGAVLGLAAHYGMGSTLLTFVSAHGVIELSVIFLAGGAGLQIGRALLNPGLYTRRDALALTAQRAVILATAAVPLLVIAGLIESFISPTSLPMAIHLMVGIGTGILLYGYLALAGRTTSPAPSPTFGRDRIQLGDAPASSPINGQYM